MPSMDRKLLPALIPVVSIILAGLFDQVRDMIVAYPRETVFTMAANSLWALFSKQPHKR